MDVAGTQRNSWHMQHIPSGESCGLLWWLYPSSASEQREATSVTIFVGVAHLVDPCRQLDRLQERDALRCPVRFRLSLKTPSFHRCDLLNLTRREFFTLGPTIMSRRMCMHPCVCFQLAWLRERVLPYFMLSSQLRMPVRAMRMHGLGHVTTLWPAPSGQRRRAKQKPRSTSASLT